MKEENGVLVLTDANYDTFMEGKDTVLVEFYAPWYVCVSGLSLLVVVPATSHLISKISPCICPFEGVATANSLHPSMRK